MVSGAQTFVGTLEDLGIKYVAGVIGSSTEEIIDALNGNPAIRYISVRHEQVAASMCDGYARVSGKPMACLAHAGPGACNMMVGVACAYRDSSPMLVFTGDLGSSRLGRDAWHELDLQGLFRPITKWTTRINSPNEIRRVLIRAYYTAVEGRPGPVHVDIPQDMLVLESGESRNAIADAASSVYLGRKSLDDNSVISNVGDKLLSAKKPLIFAGGGVYWSRGWDSLRRVANAVGAAVVTTQMGRGLLPEDDEMCLGTVGFSGSAGSNRAVKEADLILGIGCRFSETSTFGWTLIPKTTPIIHVDIDQKELCRQFPQEWGIAADARAFLDSLLGYLKSREIDSGLRSARLAWINELQKIRYSEREALFSKAANTQPISPHFAIKEVMRLSPRNSIIAKGQGNLTSVAAKIPVYGPGSSLQSAGLGTMGFGFPAALGAKLAEPDRPVLCLVGDGDFGMVMQDLDTMARESLNVIVLVLNNGGYGVNKMNQIDRGKKPFGVDFIDPDFAALARMYGINGVRVEKPDDLAPALKRALEEKGPSLLDVIIDPTLRVTANPKSVGLYT